MATRSITVSIDDGVTTVSVIYSDDTKIIPTQEGPKAVSDLAVGDHPCIPGGYFAQIVSIP